MNKQYAQQAITLGLFTAMETSKACPLLKLDKSSTVRQIYNLQFI